MINKYNLNIDDPDYHIELFWYNFKESMINFYSSGYRSSYPNKNYEHINIWSNKLNQLKMDKKYSEIENNIRNYISLYSLDLIKYSDTIYHDSILVSNIKRWDKISDMFNFEKSPNHNKIIQLFYIFLTLKENEVSKDQIKLYIDKLNIYKITNDNIDDIILDHKEQYYDDFIIYALTNNKPRILELLKIINSNKLKNDITRLYPNLKFNINSKMIKNCRRLFNGEA